MSVGLLWLVPLALLGVYLTLYVLYQSVLFLTNALVPDPPEPEPSRFRRFIILVPAHNEEQQLPRLLASAAAQDYPPGAFRTTVVADNCSDGTAAACAAHPVDVLERFDSARRGKGHAIRWALERLDLESVDALVVVDADSIVGPGFLAHLNLQLQSGDQVIQCYNGVANPGQSWFTRLMAISRTMANEILHPAKRKLGLSSHLMGNGMCFDAAVLRSRAWDALSAGEDWEYYAQLVVDGGYVGYSRGARVYHQESTGLRQASTQRLRWSSSRFAVLRRYGPSLLMRGLRMRDVRCMDAALPLVFPNPSLGINLTLCGLAAGAVVAMTGGSVTFWIWFGALALVQLAMLLVAVLYTEDPLASAASIVVAPLFLAWKMGIDVLSFFGVGGGEWKRTHRRVP
jgi:cellulose synthase/poly-beta-1,6-N-acetylglucosamine synthase-like glycosyltransferase